MRKTDYLLKNMINFIVAAFLTGATVAAVNTPARALPTDSVGVVLINGNRLIQHQVTPKETIYAVARRYSVAVANIKKANPGLKTLAVGQIILVPAPALTAGKTRPPRSAPDQTVLHNSESAQYDAQGNRVHRVTPKQTLFAIARRYGVSTADLQTWNKLSDDRVPVNQLLIVQRPVASLPTPPPRPAPAVKPESTATAPVPPLIARPAAGRPDHPAVPRPDTLRPAPHETVARVMESGLAELISRGAMSHKYLALHKTAPIGSFLTVRNIMNNRTVSVRVIGKLPDIGANEKVVVKVSKRAFQRLGALDNRFLVEVQYEVVESPLSVNR